MEWRGQDDISKLEFLSLLEYLFLCCDALIGRDSLITACGSILLSWSGVRVLGSAPGLVLLVGLSTSLSVLSHTVINKNYKKLYSLVMEE
jgi:hypothetical protein